MIKFKRKSITTIVMFIILPIMCVFYCLGYYNIKSNTRSLEERLKNTEYALNVANDKLELETSKALGLSEELALTKWELDKANTTIADLKSDAYELVYMGDFKITYYCDGRYPHICGGNGVTASGKPTEVGVTAAADWDVLPEGSMVYISGIGFREIQDVGSAVNDNHIDVLVQEHQEALDLGTDYEGVWLLIKN